MIDQPIEQARQDERGAPKAAWVAPVVQVIAAGEAESGTRTTADATFTTS